MKTLTIDDNWGLIILPSKNESIFDLEYNEIVSLFEQYGVLLFRGFDLQPEKITKVTNRYTEKYSGEALRRPSRYGQKVVHDVDTSGMDMGRGVIGGAHVDWHSENGFAPSWPEVIWLYCNVPPKKAANQFFVMVPYSGSIFQQKLESFSLQTQCVTSSKFLLEKKDLGRVNDHGF